MKKLLGIIIIALILLLALMFDYYDIKSIDKYKQYCYNDSVPAYSRDVSSRLTLYEAKEDSMKFSTIRNISTYSIRKQGVNFPKFIVKETSKTYNHKQPTLYGYENWLKK